MGDEHYGLMITLIGKLQQRQNFLRILSIQISGRLVGQKDGRPVNKRPSDSGPLLLPSGKLARKMGQSVTEA